MENIYEIVPFVKEMLAQKPSRRMLKLYLFGSLMALLGTVIGLMESVYQPFSSGEPLDAELVMLIDRENRTLETEERNIQKQVAILSYTDQITIHKNMEFEATGLQRAAGSANRLYAS